MSATAWLIYNEAKKYIGNGTIQLGTTALKMKLTNSASNASTFTLSTFASISGEIRPAMVEALRRAGPRRRPPDSSPPPRR